MKCYNYVLISKLFKLNISSALESCVVMWTASVTVLRSGCWLSAGTCPLTFISKLLVFRFSEKVIYTTLGYMHYTRFMYIY